MNIKLLPINLKDKIIKSQFSKDVLPLILGTTISQFLLLLSTPIITRLYSPENFGLYSLYLTITSLVSIVIMLKYESMIVISKKNSEALNILKICVILSILMGSLLILSINLLNKFTNIKYINEYFYIINLAIFSGVFSSAITINYNWLNRNKAYKKLGFLKVYQSAVSILISFLMGFLKYSAGLIYAQLITTILFSILFFKKIIKLRKWNYSKIKISAKNNISAPKYLLIITLIDTISIQIPILLITSYFGLNDAGQYSLASRVLSIPAILIGGAIGQIYLQRVSREIINNIKLVRKKYMKLNFILFCFIFLPALIIIMYGEIIFIKIFGDQWALAGKLSEVMVISSAMFFIFSSTSSIMLVLEGHKTLLTFAIIQGFYRFIAINYTNDINDYIQLLVFFEVLNLLLFFIVVLHRLYLNSLEKFKNSEINRG